MPGLMSVAEYVQETREDYNSPTTSTFVSKMPQCRQTIGTLEETLDFDRDGLTKMKKAIKAIFNSGSLHVDNEEYLSQALEKLGGNAWAKDQEPDIGDAFKKFSVVTKELSALMKTLMQNINNIVMFPVDNLLKGDLRGVKGDLKKPFDRAWKEYEAKMSKLEKEKKQQAKEAGLIRTEVTPAEVADEMEKERKMFQLQMCEYLIKVNEIKTKKGVELLQHLVEYYHAQTNFFQDGLKTIQHFNGYINELSGKLQRIRQKQDEERKKLGELKTLLKSFEKDQACGYSLHQLQGNKSYGYSKVGVLLKKSEGKMRKVWQKRRCEIKDGFLFISHSDESKQPTKLNLLTCQVKQVPDDKRCFDLISYNRTYHFQADDENEAETWMSVLINCKEGALMKAFDNCGKKVNQSLMELQQSIIRHATLNQARKPNRNSSMEERSEFIRAKYMEKKFAIRTCTAGGDLLNDLEHAVASRHIYHLLQAFVEGADLTVALPNNALDDTSLHVAVAREEDETSLHVVDFLVQNSGTLDKQNRDGNTALHICIMQNQTECCKLLLRSGANPNIENNARKLPLDIAKERGHVLCQELLLHAIEGKKELFENVSVEWALTADDVSTDVSDDDLDDRIPTGGSSTPEKRIRSRPPSFAAADSPGVRSRASTTGSSPVAATRNSAIPPPPPPQNKKPIIPGLNSHGSIKKRAAPPPPMYPQQQQQCHTRTPSDPTATTNAPITSIIDNNNHKRTPSTDSANWPPEPVKVPLSTSLPTSLGPKPMVSTTTEFSSLKNVNENSHQSKTPPEKIRLDNSRPRRCRALYDCDADNEDELSFQEGEVIVILNEHTADENWMEGTVEGSPQRKGMFPVSFVHMLSD
uniref:ArfGAP with SH3 domain, ANK repeat and PH domain-containing protein n=1 Tax=Strigamia maritima TaxID=126957 RepID=T1J7C5_STRMM